MTKPFRGISLARLEAAVPDVVGRRVSGDDVLLEYSGIGASVGDGGKGGASGISILLIGGSPKTVRVGPGGSSDLSGFLGLLRGFAPEDFSLGCRSGYCGCRPFNC